MQTNNHDYYLKKKTNISMDNVGRKKFKANLDIELIYFLNINLSLVMKP